MLPDLLRRNEAEHRSDGLQVFGSADVPTAHELCDDVEQLAGGVFDDFEEQEDVGVLHLLHDGDLFHQHRFREVLLRGPELGRQEALVLDLHCLLNSCYVVLAVFVVQRKLHLAERTLAQRLQQHVLVDHLVAVVVVHAARSFVTCAYLSSRRSSRTS